MHALTLKACSRHGARRTTQQVNFFQLNPMITSFPGLLVCSISDSLRSNCNRPHVVLFESFYNSQFPLWGRLS